MKKREREPRECVVKVRVGASERMALEVRAALEGITVAHLLRLRALDEGNGPPAVLALSSAGLIGRRA
jgi:hypothetical protein